MIPLQSSCISSFRRSTTGVRQFERLFSSWFFSSRKYAMPREKIKKFPISNTKLVPKGIKRPSYAYTGSIDTFIDHIVIQSDDAVHDLRNAARVARNVCTNVINSARVGMTTDELDTLCHNMILDYKCYPSPLNYLGFPKSCCTSVNEIACHGIPDSRALRHDDLLKVDVSIFNGKVHGDTCMSKRIFNKDIDLDTTASKDVDDVIKRLCDQWRIDYLINTTSACLDRAISVIGPGKCLSSIGAAIDDVCKEMTQSAVDSEFYRSNSKIMGDKIEYNVLSSFYGHGVGQLLHMKPLVCHTSNTEKLVLQPGMVFTIEPIIVDGNADYDVWKEDGWTAQTRDRSLCGQFEHTVLITDDGVEVLTVTEEENVKYNGNALNRLK